MNTSTKATLFSSLLCTWLGLLGCQRAGSTQAELYEFSKPSITRIEEMPFKLARAKDIPHRVVRKTVETGQYFFDSYVFDAEFSVLTKNDFDALKATYGGWSQTVSRVHYDKQGPWMLSDFIPPAMQAALDSRFINERRIVQLPQLFGLNPSTDRVDTPVLLLSNCWGTLYEVLRHARTSQENPTLELFYAPHKAARAVFFDSRWSTELRPYTKQATFTPAERNAGLQPGDVLLVGGDWLQHVAIFVDDDLYFEKAGAGNTALYRLTDWETLSKTWPPDLHGFSWRRYNRESFPESSALFNMNSSLPSEVSLDRLNADEVRHFTLEPDIDDKTGKPVGGSWFERRVVPFTFDARGRAQLEIPTRAR